MARNYDWTKNACYERTPSNSLNGKYALLEKQYLEVLKEKEALRKELNELRVRSNAFEERIVKEFDALLIEMDTVATARDELQREQHSTKGE